MLGYGCAAFGTVDVDVDKLFARARALPTSLLEPVSRHDRGRSLTEANSGEGFQGRNTKQ